MGVRVLPAAMGRFVHVVVFVVFVSKAAPLTAVVAPVLPILEVSLAPPVNPMPVVSTQIGNVERRVDETVQAGLALIRKAYARALKDAHARIDTIVDRAMVVLRTKRATSFMAAGLAPGDVASVTVRVSDAPANVPAAGEVIATLGHSMVQGQLSFFEEVARDMSRVSDEITERLRVELHRQLEAALGHGGSLPSATGFLAAPVLPRQLSVRSVASETPYASAASMVRDMAVRTDATNNLAVATALNMMAQLIHDENALIVAKLKTFGRR